MQKTNTQKVLEYNLVMSFILIILSLSSNLNGFFTGGYIICSILFLLINNIAPEEEDLVKSTKEGKLVEALNKPEEVVAVKEVPKEIEEKTTNSRNKPSHRKQFKVSDLEVSNELDEKKDPVKRLANSGELKALIYPDLEVRRLVTPAPQQNISFDLPKEEVCPQILITLESTANEIFQMQLLCLGVKGEVLHRYAINRKINNQGQKLEVQKRIAKWNARASTLHEEPFILKVREYLYNYKGNFEIICFREDVEFIQSVMPQDMKWSLVVVQDFVEERSTQGAVPRNMTQLEFFTLFNVIRGHKGFYDSVENLMVVWKRLRTII